MEIEIEELFKGKATKIKDKEYFPTEAYVTPFIERMSKLTSNFIIKVKPADQISLTKEGEINFDDIVYNRVNIEAILPEDYSFDGYKRVIGFVYALDSRKPVVKQYVGGIRSACLNLCVFNPEALSIQELEPLSSINYSFTNSCLTITDTVVSKLRKLEQIEYTREACYEQLGLWIDRCISNKFISNFGTVKLAESTPIDAYKNLFYNDKSEYFTKENSVNGLQIYNSFTDIICNTGKSTGKEELLNRFEKVYLVSKLLGI